jgi:BioD-like phosphotransacetylase family protein
MRKKSGFPGRRFKKRAVMVAINGGVRLGVLANQLQIPLKKVRRWKQKFQGEIKRRQLPAKKVQAHLNLLQAFSQRSQIQSRIVELKGALRGNRGKKGALRENLGKKGAMRRKKLKRMIRSGALAMP